MIVQRSTLLFNKYQLLVVQKHIDALSRTQPFVFMTYKPEVLTPENMHILMTTNSIFNQKDPYNNRLVYGLAKDMWEEYKYLSRVYDLNVPYRFKYSTHDVMSYKMFLQVPNKFDPALTNEEQMLIAMLC